jgi:hypothetical protein
MAVNLRAWTKKEPAIPRWATPRSWLSRSEVAAVLQVPRSTLQRLARRGDGPPYDMTSFGGNAVRYRLVHVLAWWGRITRRLPGTPDGVWAWWIDQGLNLKKHRDPPRERGNRPKGMRRRRWTQVCRVKTRSDLQWATLAVAALDANHPQARRELLDMAHELRGKAPART